MAKFRIDMLCRCGDSGGSEVYYAETETRDTALERAVELAALRAALMPPIAQVQGWRTTPLSSQGLPSGRQHSVDKTEAPVTGTGPGLRTEQDVVLRTVMTDATGDYVKQLHMRFPPADWVLYDANGNFAAPAPLTAAFTPFKNSMISGAWYTRTFNGNLNSNPDSALINQISFDQDGLMSVTLNDAIPSLAPGDRVKIIGYKGTFGKQVNGMTTILGTTGTNVLILDKIACKYKSLTGAGSGAAIFKESYLFDVITKCENPFPARRDIGRPFFLERGRRSKRPYCLFTPAVASLTG